MTEAELAQQFIAYIKESFEEMYFEICDIDIVGINKKIITAIEVKTSLNFKVIEQAYNNHLNYTHYSYIAVPAPKTQHFGFKICRMLGIGVLLFHETKSRKYNYIEEKIPPKLNRHVSTNWFKPEDRHKISLPGSPSGKNVITAFNVTTENILKYVQRHPGCTVKDLFNNINHHYSGLSSMRNCLYRYIRDDVISGIEIYNSKLYLTSSEEYKKLVSVEQKYLNL